MKYEIHVDNEFLDLLEEPVQDFIKEISFKNKPIFYLINHSAEGKVEKDLCQMMNEMIEDGKITYEEKTSIKNFYSLHKDKEKNLPEYRTNTTKEELNKIKDITSKIKNHNLNFYNKKKKENIQEESFFKLLKEELFGEKEEDNIKPQVIIYVAKNDFQREYYEKTKDYEFDY